MEKNSTICRSFLRPFAIALLIFPLSALALTELSLVELIERTLDGYPELSIAEKEVERARQELPKVEGLLGFTLGGRAGYSRDRSFIGTPSDTFTASGNLGRMLETGERLSFSATYRREDNSGGAIFRGYPNPADTINLDLEFRKPLRKGRGNPDYSQGLIIAGEGVTIAEANRRERREQLASQAIELFHAALLTRYRLESSQRAIDRALRLKRYIQKKMALGLAERKDRLQAEARLRAEEATHRSLKLVWRQQRVALNRLIGEPWDNPFRLRETLETFPVSVADIDAFFEDAVAFSPAMQRSRGRLKIAEAAIERQRDKRRDKLDLVVTAGVRNLSGDAGRDYVDKSDLAGGVALEFQRALDPRQFDAALYQAQLERDQVLEEMKNLRYQLRYRIAGLVEEILENQRVLQKFRQRLQAEREKYRESERLYRDARIDTSLLLQHEAELQGAELAFQQQRIELLKRYATLELLRGRLMP